ncbi:MAG: filamentous hemagglutinin N-terminal domain-containing protein [Methylococcales bacterium]
MNHIYRSMWSESLATWIAVPEYTKGKAKNLSKGNKSVEVMTVSPSKDWLSCSPLLATSLLLCSSAAWALPTGEQLVAGQAIVNTPSAGQMQIDQTSQQAIINWQGFSIAPNEAVNIQQPNAQAALLNRVVGQDASQIQGQLHANGQVYLVNPNGVVFGKTAQVDVGGLIASTHNIKDADFLNGVQHFTQDNATGTVSNQGAITTPDGGVVAFIGNQVSNDGTINTPKGTTALAAGKTVDLDFTGNGLIEVKVSEAALNAQITNKGAIQADGGRVVLTAKAAGQLIDTVINQAGIIKAQGMIERNGEIILDGGDTGITQVSGTLNASGNKAGEQGGKIVVTGDRVLIESTAKLSATGNTGGGEVLVGGSWQNSDPSIRQATATVIKAGAVLDASATDNGKGGTVVAWSDIHNTNSVTRAYGTFLAKGGINGGDGGRIETSGHWLSTDNIKVGTSAPLGKSGSWLLDPFDVNIVNFPTPASGDPFTNTFTPTQDSTILASDISVALNGNNVTITTAGGNLGSAGNININGAINWSSSNTLTLRADSDITINAPIQSTGNGNFIAITDDPTLPLLHPNISSSNITLNSSIDMGTGTVTLVANSFPDPSLNPSGGLFICPSCTSIFMPITARQYWVYSRIPTNPFNFGPLPTGVNKHYNQTYTTGSVPGYATTGNWFLYSIAPPVIPPVVAPVVTPPVVAPVVTPPVIDPVIDPDVTPVTSTPVNPEILSSQITSLQTSTTFQPFSTVIDTSTNNSASTPDSDLSVSDVSNDFSSNTPSNSFFQSLSEQEDNKKTILPILQIKNSAGKVKRLQLSENKQFLSLLMEDGSVRIWDFERGVQRSIMTENKEQALTDISAVDDKGESLSIASKAGIGLHDIISSVTDDKLAINELGINHFVTANDGSLLLMNVGANKLSLWDSKQSKQRWSFDHERGVVNNLALSDDKHYGAVLSRQPNVYAMDKNNKFKPLTDAVDIIDLATGKVIKALPNAGENIVYMRFKNNDTLLVGLASGKLLNWSMAAGSKKAAGEFTESMVAVDNSKEAYAYVAENGTVRIGNGQGHLHLSIQNKDNPIKEAKLLDNGKKLLTVLASGDVALWDVESGKKLLRLFSTKQGWTVMDAYGRFDGSDEAMENFSWLAGEENIPLDSFSENYYEPGLLTNVLQNKDYLNSNPEMVADGISLPPKVQLQLDDHQDKIDKVTVKLDVYDRGGGIDKVSVYHNGKLIRNEEHTTDEQTSTENEAEHRALTLNVTPSAGKNSLKVTASNSMGIESSSSELSFDGKTKAYSSAVRLLTVGINDYKESQLHLNYSVADAQLINDSLKNGSKIANNKLLINENATKAKILAELKEISQGTEQDVLVIYFAGHGVALDKEWYFLPYETKLEPSLKKIVAAGISATDLSDIFKNSKIQHILLMVDSCHSGASMDVFSTLQNGQRYFTRQLGRSLGITVITAAAKDQEAAEMKSLGHGLFTYLISQEIANKESDKSITAHSIAENIAKTLPAFSKKTIGISQDPVVYTKGNDFMLTDLLKGKK